MSEHLRENLKALVEALLLDQTARIAAVQGAGDQLREMTRQANHLARQIESAADLSEARQFSAAMAQLKDRGATENLRLAEGRAGLEVYRLFGALLEAALVRDPSEESFGGLSGPGLVALASVSAGFAQQRTRERILHTFGAQALKAVDAAGREFIRPDSSEPEKQ